MSAIEEQSEEETLCGQIWTERSREVLSWRRSCFQPLLLRCRKQGKDCFTRAYGSIVRVEIVRNGGSYRAIGADQRWPDVGSGTVRERFGHARHGWHAWPASNLYDRVCWKTAKSESGLLSIPTAWWVDRSNFGARFRAGCHRRQCSFHAPEGRSDSFGRRPLHVCSRKTRFRYSDPGAGGFCMEPEPQERAC
jgi:hypothetical protein